MNRLWKWPVHDLNEFFDKNGRTIRVNWVAAASWLVLLLAVCWNFSQIYRLAADIPFEDEWDYLSTLENCNFSSIFEVSVEHRIVFTKLLFLLSYWFDSLNIRHLIICNWFIYLFLVFSVIVLFYKKLKITPCYPLLFLPFFADIAYDNFLRSGQSQFHFLLLFGTWALYFGFRSEKSYRDMIIFWLFLFLSIFSMNPMLAVIIVFVWSLKQGLCWLKSAESERRFILYSVLLTGLVTVIGLLLFFVDYRPSASMQESSSLRSILVYCYANSIKVFTMGPPSGCSALGRRLFYLPFIIPALLFLYILYRQKTALLIKNSPAAAILVWSFTLCAVIAFSRGSFFAPRHLEAILPATPAIAAIFLAEKNRNIRNLGFYSYLFGLLIVLSFSFSFHEAVQKQNLLKKEFQILLQPRQEYQCLFLGHIYSEYWNFEEQIERAKKLNISCFQKKD